eukprot:762497-Hanusia_phi.AAC.5
MPQWKAVTTALSDYEKFLKVLGKCRVTEFSRSGPDVFSSRCTATTRQNPTVNSTATGSNSAAARDGVGSVQEQHGEVAQERPNRPGGSSEQAAAMPAVSTPKRDAAGGSTLESPQGSGLVQSMLSQETLFTPLRQRESYYTKFLAERGENLPEEELNRYRRQFGLVKKICQVLEKEPFDVNKLLYLMQLLQDSGDPPPEVNSLTAAH